MCFCFIKMSFEFTNLDKSVKIEKNVVEGNYVIFRNVTNRKRLGI